MFELAIFYLDLFGVAVFAISGVLAAARSKQSIDLFGVVVLATITALGGGTLRDVVINQPAIWVTESLYLIVTTVTALLTFALVHTVAKMPKILFDISDAIGLAVFTIIGMEKALSAGLSPMVAVVLGIMTGVFGGILRDVLIGKTPHILRKEIYATAALLGALVYLALGYFVQNSMLSLLVAIFVTLMIRLIAIHYRMHLPALDA